MRSQLSLLMNSWFCTCLEEVVVVAIINAHQCTMGSVCKQGYVEPTPNHSKIMFKVTVYRDANGLVVFNINGQTPPGNVSGGVGCSFAGYPSILKRTRNSSRMPNRISNLISKRLPPLQAFVQHPWPLPLLSTELLQHTGYTLGPNPCGI